VVAGDVTLNTEKGEYLARLSTSSAGRLNIDWIEIQEVTSAEKSSWGHLKDVYRRQ
jgi:hypothetical protein